MKVTNLTGGCEAYTSNAFLVQGDWNSLADINTLVDVGRTPLLFDALAQARTGVGKRPVEQVVLTHSHFDHVGMLAEIRERFSPVVHAFRAFEGVDEVLEDGQCLRLGDREFEVVHVTAHSQDSICLVCAEDGVVFAGDTPLIVTYEQSNYDASFLDALERIRSRGIRTIYPGHGPARTSGASEAIGSSIELLRARALATAPAVGTSEGNDGGEAATPIGRGLPVKHPEEEIHNVQ